MISYATISDDFSQGWQHGFNDGDTVEVDTASVTSLILVAATVNVQAIRLNQSLSFLGNDSVSSTKSNVINIGSIYGVGNSVQKIYAGGSMSDAGQVWTLNGNAGEDNNPIQNNYSGIQLIHLIGKSTFNLDAPITLDSEFQIASGELNVTININDDITIVHPSITSIGSNGIFNIATAKTLTLSGSDMNLTSPFNFSNLGILTLSGNNTIFNPSSVSNVNNAVLNINNDVQTNMSSILTINTINIADGKSFTIDAVNGDINLLDNNASINFGGSGAILALTNSGTSDRIFTAYNTLAGDVLFSSDGSLVANNGVDGSVTTATDNTGTITIGSGDVGVIGTSDKKLKLVNLGQGEAASVKALYATNVSIGGLGPITATELITSAVSFSSSGSLIADNEITGDVDFAGNDGVLQLADSQTIVGNVDSSSASAGTLEFLGKGTVTGTIGATNAITSLKFSGAGASTIPGTANATTIEIANAGAVVTASEVLTGNVLFSSTGSLIANSGITGNVDFAGNDGTLSLANNQTITVNVDSSSASAGTLEFLGKGTVTGTIGATNAITSLKFSGAGANTIPGTANVTIIEVANASAVVTASEALTGNVLFSSDGSLIANAGVTGSVTTNTDNTGTITVSSGDVGAIGASDKKLKQVNLNQGTAASVGKLYASNVNIGGLGPITATDLITAAVSFSSDGSLIAKKDITGNIDFNNTAGILEINSNNDNFSILNTTIVNTDNATLNIKSSVITNSDSIGNVSIINVDDTKFLVISADNKNINLLENGHLIKFGGISTVLALINSDNNNPGTITLNDNLQGVTNGGGILWLSGTTQLTLQGADETQSLGTVNNKLKSLYILNNVMMEDSIDASNAEQLFIVNGAMFVDNSTTSTSIPTINIGASASFPNNVIPTGPATYTLDAINGDFSINTDNIVYENEDSVLALGSTSEDEERTITLKTSIVPRQDKYGILTLYSTGDKKLTIDNNGDDAITIGTTENRLKQLTLSSDGDAEFDIRPEINVETLGLDLSKIDLGVVDANIIFRQSTQYNANGNINGDVDFAGNDGVINIADNVNISRGISSTDATSGELNFLGGSTIEGLVSNISTMQAGAGNVTFITSGDYSIGELQGNGSGTITFPTSVNFIGGINTTGGEPLNLSFSDSTSITGNIGSTSNPVGDMSSSSNIEFNGDINSNGDITTLGTTLFAGNVTCNNILANNEVSSSSFSLLRSNYSNITSFALDNVTTTFQGEVNTTGNIQINGSAYFADTVNSQGSVIINGDTQFNKELSSSSDITISSGSNAIFNGDVSASNINIDNANIKILDNISMQGNINASNSSVLLDNNTLTISGISTFSNQITISTIYDESSLSGGNIILTSGSTLDLSNVSKLTIKLAFINSDISQITDDTKYSIIIAEDGSNIILLSDPDNQIVLDSSGEQNKFVKWTLDVSSLTLYASDNSNNAIDTDYVFDSQQNNSFMQELKNALPGSIAQSFKKNIGLLSKEQVEEMLSRILDHPKERNSEIVRVALQQALTDTHKTAMQAIQSRISGTSVAVSAGEEDMNKYGVWGRSSINHSKDKVSGKKLEYFNSYKTRGHSNTIGIDGLIYDSILLGIAYTNSYTNIRPQNQNIGDTDKVRSNMFSLYSAYNIPNYNWYLDGTISYAESSVRGQNIRNLAIARNVLGTEIASSNYKSYLYSGSVSLGYHHHISNDIYVTPSLGVIGSLIRDKGYEESGTSFQDLSVRKKNYNKLSGIGGLRAYQNIYLDNIDGIVVTPEVYGFINYAIKNKTPAIDARLAGIDERLPTINYRSNRIDYNLGLGVTVKHKMMEYGINYDANLAKKYQGHSGSLKVRVNL